MTSTHRSVFFRALAAGAIMALAAAPLQAGLTLISNSASLNQLLYNQYGGGVGGYSGSVNSAFSYVNGVTLIRVQDFSGSANFSAGTAALPGPVSGNLDILSAYSGLQDDQSWQGVAAATVQARYRSAAHTQDFGYSDGAGYPAGKSFTHMFSLSNGVNSPAAPVGPIPLPDVFRWARTDVSQNSKFLPGAGWEHSSLNTDNIDGRDHMITFYISDPGHKILPLDATTGWLICFEDLNVGSHPDYDYNDSIIQVTASPLVRTPEPATLAVLAVGGLLGLRRRRVATSAA